VSAPEVVSLRKAISMALNDAMAEDERVVLIGEDIADPMGGSYKVTAGLSTKYGTGRVRNTPISEAAIVGAAIGAALAGLRPVAEVMYVDFTAIAMDQIVNQAAFISYMSGGQLSVPMVIRCQGGAWRTASAQHSKTLEAWFAHVPGLRFMAPATPADAYWMLREAIADPNPVIYFESALLYRDRAELDPTCRPAASVSPRLVREGQHVTAVTWGGCIPSMMKAAENLEGDGISVEVFDLRQLSPIDYGPLAASLRRTGLLLIAHEAWETGGLGGEIAARLGHDCFDYLDGPIKRVGALHCPHPFAPVLEHAMMPSSERIADVVREWFR
jgi:acetoin:2,6-dichlorophenolindophenol oxidoreductase subunit beta